MGGRALLRLARTQSAPGQRLRGDNRIRNRLPLCRFRPAPHPQARPIMSSETDSERHALPPANRGGLMPRYFFHVIDGRASIDHEGTVLAGIDEARSEAIRTAGEILRQNSAGVWTGHPWQMTV